MAINGYNFSPLLKQGILPNYEPRKIGDVKFVQDLTDLPAASGGKITLAADTAYYITNHLDLQGSRLEFSGTASLIGTSSETSFITSTGLAASTPLITTSSTLSMQEITIHDVGTAVLINGGTTAALDWIGVNFLNVPTIGTINGASNFIYIRSAFLNSKGLEFKGTIGTIGFTDCLFVGDGAAGSILTTDAALTINARFRMADSSVIATGSTSGINFNSATTIPVESFILRDVNFSGGGAYLPDLNYDDNKSLFRNSKGVTNTARVAHYYMNNNAVPTVILATNTPVKVAGITTLNTAVTQKFTHTDNRVTYVGAITEFFQVSVAASLVSSSNNIVGMYVAVNGVVLASSEMYATTNAGGRAESISTITVVELKQGDYVEIWVENNTGINNITAEYLNVIVKGLS